MSSAAKKTLSSPQWQLLSQLFEEGSLLSGADRENFLAQQDINHPEIAPELRRLLGSTDTLDDFLVPNQTRRLAQIYDEVQASDDLGSGTQIGEFLISEVLGKGAFATVYLATEINLGREVALKVSTGSTEEAKTIAALDHRSIVQVYSEHVDEKSRLRLICMQYVRGASLDAVLLSLDAHHETALNGETLLKALDSLSPSTIALNIEEIKLRERLSELDEIETILALGIQMCEALSYAHSRHVLHLDMKPGNILFNHCGTPMLSDFNIAIRGLQRDVLPANFGGTPEYMSPEQRGVFEATDKTAAFSKIEAAADIYSLGRVLEELFLRARPSSRPDALVQSERNLAIDLQIATDKNPKRRFAAAADFARSLETCLELRLIEKRLGNRGNLARFSQRHPLLVLTLMGAVPQVFAALIGFSYNSIQIFNHLTPSQRVTFLKTNAIYTPLSYGLVSLLWLSAVLRLYPFLRRPERYRSHLNRIDSLKRQVLRLPLWGMFCSAVGWLPGAVLYPWVIQSQAGALGGKVIFHFVVSFCLSWLIGLSYSYLFHQYIVLRDLYPRFWIGSSDDRRFRSASLVQATSLTRLCLSLCILVPLGGALLVLQAGQVAPVESFAAFKRLVSVLIFMGISGVLFSAAVGPLLVRCLGCFRTDDSKSVNSPTH